MSAARGVHVRMLGRVATESHRASTPLELLFDLTFVVAVAQLASAYAHGLGAGHGILGSAVPFMFVFFAIWWAWMNFTWFSSAYDTDDVLYRLFTLVQMAGVLVLAAGVPAAFDESDFLVITIGYLIMRIGLIAQWVRAAIEHPDGRTTATRYAIGLAVSQAGWVARLWLPEEWAIPSFVVLALLDLSVPLWAERTGMTPWHPHHIAERYGLFVIILLGESVFAATNGVSASLAASGLTPELVVIAVAGLLILFGVWWIYFAEPVGEGLARHRAWSFFWGYGHYPLLAAIAAIGAGLELAVLAIDGHLAVPDEVVAIAVAVPVGAVLGLIWLVHRPLVDGAGVPAWLLLPAAAIVFATPLAAGWLTITGVIAVVAAIVVLAVVGTIAEQSVRAKA
jgi:low temperature requirement protein LtrA